MNDRALAERLSLWFWNTIPDAELSELANKGTLHRPDILRTIGAVVEGSESRPVCPRFSRSVVAGLAETGCHGA